VFGSKLELLLSNFLPEIASLLLEDVFPVGVTAEGPKEVWLKLLKVLPDDVFVVWVALVELPFGDTDGFCVILLLDRGWILCMESSNP